MKQYFILFSLAVLPISLLAQTPLTLDECVELARQNNKALIAADKQMLSARFDKRAMKANFFPSFSAVGGGVYSTVDGKLDIAGGQLPVIGANGQPTGSFAYFPGMSLSYEVGWLYGGGVSVEQPIYLGGKVRAGYRMARLASELAAQNRRLTESEVIVETSKAYANVVRARELRSVAERYNTLLTELLRSVESAYKHGMKSQNDVLKVQVKLNESALNLRKAENGFRLATMNLCHYIGRPLTDRPEVGGDLPDVATASFPTADMTARPEYQMLERKSLLAQEQVRVARSERLPQVGLVGNYGYMHGAELNSLTALDGWNFSVGVRVSVPIFHFGARSGKMRSAQAKYEQTVAEQQNSDELLTLEMTRAANDLDEARLELRLADSSLAAADENLRVSGRQYEVGMEALSDYLEAQTMWQQAHQMQIEARVNSYLRWLEYRKATGVIN